MFRYKIKVKFAHEGKNIQKNIFLIFQFYDKVTKLASI